MKLTVTKQQILKAIKTEPLRGGTFVEIGHFEGDAEEIKALKLKNNTKCPVCAVGSILDLAIGKKATPSFVSETANRLTEQACLFNGDVHPSEIGDEEIRKAIFTADDGYGEVNIFVNNKDLVKAAAVVSKKKPLSALSSLFEALMEKEEMKTSNNFANYRARRILTNFVKNNFPSKLELDTKKEY